MNITEDKDLKNGTDLNGDQVHFPIKVTKLLEFPASIHFKTLGGHRYYPGKDIYKGRAYLGLDKKKRLMFQIAIWGPKQLYIRVTLSKYYVLEMSNTISKSNQSRSLTKKLTFRYGTIIRN